MGRDTELGKPMETKLTLIARRAKEGRACRFNNLMHVLNEESLKECFYLLRRTAAAGVDKQTVAAYEENLDENLRGLVERMKRMSWRPQAVRRVYIPKADGGKRPLGIPAIEDKVVQMGMARILEAIYEADFLDCSYGFRQGRSAHQSLRTVDREIMRKPVGWVIDADIRGFFDNVDHEWMKRCIEQRVSDRKFVRYIMRTLKSGVMEGGQRSETEKGTPQGGIISPVLANVYLHYVLDLWFEKRVKKQCGGYASMVRYADDFIILVERKEEAEQILVQLRERLAKFGLELSAAKTRITRMSMKQDVDDSGTFNFLGFTHYRGASRWGKAKLSRKTEKKRFARSVQNVVNWMRVNRNAMPLEELWRKLRVVMEGHYRYFGVSDNMRSETRYERCIEKAVLYWLNKRSQKKSFTWESFTRYLKKHPLPRPRIYHVLYAGA
jgi:RNA-directed DNA polymerase